MTGVYRQPACRDEGHDVSTLRPAGAGAFPFPVFPGQTMRMHNPPHPGEVLRTLCIQPLGLTVTEAARALDVSRKTLSEILNGHAGISPEMAIRLSLAFDTTAESWLAQQLQYDLWCAEQKRGSLQVKRLTAA